MYPPILPVCPPTGWHACLRPLGQICNVKSNNFKVVQALQYHAEKFWILISDITTDKITTDLSIKKFIGAEV